MFISADPTWQSYSKKLKMWTIEKLIKRYPTLVSIVVLVLQILHARRVFDNHALLFQFNHDSIPFLLLVTLPMCVLQIAYVIAALVMFCNAVSDPRHVRKEGLYTLLIAYLGLVYCARSLFFQSEHQLAIFIGLELEVIAVALSLIYALFSAVIALGDILHAELAGDAHRQRTRKLEKKAKRAARAERDAELEESLRESTATPDARRDNETCSAE